MAQAADHILICEGRFRGEADMMRLRPSWSWMILIGPQRAGSRTIVTPIPISAALRMMSAVSITPSGWHLRRLHSQRRQARQLTCPAGNQSRVDATAEVKRATIRSPRQHAAGKTKVHQCQTCSPRSPEPSGPKICLLAGPPCSFPIALTERALPQSVCADIAVRCR
jgi:hypothetical protein